MRSGYDRAMGASRYVHYSLVKPWLARPVLGSVELPDGDWLRKVLDRDDVTAITVELTAGGSCRYTYEIPD